MEFPVGEHGETYFRSGQGPVGIKYFNESKSGWMINHLVYNIDSDDVEAVIEEPNRIKITSTRSIYKFKEFDNDC